MSMKGTSYEDMIRLVCQIIIEELCKGGGVRGAAIQIVQIISSWTQDNLK